METDTTTQEKKETWPPLDGSSPVPYQWIQKKSGRGKPHLRSYCVNIGGRARKKRAGYFGSQKNHGSICCAVHYTQPVQLCARPYPRVPVWLITIQSPSQNWEGGMIHGQVFIVMKVVSARHIRRGEQAIKLSDYCSAATYGHPP